MQLGSGYGLDPFGIELIAGREEGDTIGWMVALGKLHVPLAWSLLILVVGHAGMALLHQFVKKDGVMQRML